MAKATLLAEGLSQFVPTTNHYGCDDGRYLLVSIPSFDVAGTLETAFGVSVPILKSHIPTQADVFLADENAVVLDADGDPANGMTPLVSVEGCADHAEALAAAGYELVDGVV